MNKNREYPERPFVGVGVIVLHNEEVLLVQRGKSPNKGHWSIPGGKQRLGETIFQAARREIFEETGVKVDQLALIDVVDIIIPDGEGKIRYHYTVVDFQGQWLSGECRSGDDAYAVNWFKLNELGSLSLSEKEKVIILKAANRSDLI